MGWKHVARDATIATVRTLRRWHRTLIAQTSTKPHGGKKRILRDTIDLVIQFALDNAFGNDAWGRKRIKDEMTKLGITICASTIRNILQRHGIPPAPNRGRGRDEPEVIIGNFDNTVAIDFCTTTVFIGNVLTILYVLLAIHIPTRRAAVIGINRNPKGAFMAHCADILTTFVTSVNATNVLMDHDKIFSATFRKRMLDVGASVSRTDIQCPWQNGYVRTICADR